MELLTRFKIATTAAEFEQVHRLNYRTFVEEIPQHAPNPDGRHVDKFHRENTYIIGVREDRVIAQLAIRRCRPFSLDGKLPDLDRWLPPGRRVVELRLLAVDPAHRNGPVAAQLLQYVARHCLDRGDDLAVISGAVRRLRLYRALGFEEFGRLVGTPEAPYQPMFLTLEKFLRAMEARRGLRADGIRAADRETVSETEPVNLLPGPVAVSPGVLAALGRRPISHRAPEFIDQLTSLRRRIAALTHASDVQVMPGSGSLANDIIAGQLHGLNQPGVVISTGEFGERLAEHARRASLDFHWARLPWGTSLTRDRLEAALADVAAPRWLWLVHHETSTGVLHDLTLLKTFARDNGLMLCLDCISSVGAISVDLARVALASATSGKGLGSVPGLALVFHSELPPPRADLPRYLDLGLWAVSDGVPFTHSSNLVMALDVAVAEVERASGGSRCGSEIAEWFRAELRAAGFALVADEAHASPVIVSIALPPEIPAGYVGEELERRGFIASFRSSYLSPRNWIQFCLIGAPSRAILASLVGELRSTVEVLTASPSPDRTAAPSSTPPGN
jgi:aspartate aminotransferase-like enzyme/GNAT superfamily N-acetyltransferase